MTRKPSVAVMDVDRINARSLEKTLTRHGFSVAVSDDGTRFRHMLKSREFSALIIDVLMSRTTKLDLIIWVRQCWPTMRIVAMSNFASYALEQECVSKGADLFVRKPIDTALLAEFLRDGNGTDLFSGFVEDVDIIEYLQFLVWTERTLILEVISRGGTKGKIWLTGGDIVHATSEALVGEPALYRCLSFKGGKFSSLSWTEPDSSSIHKPSEFLIMEAARSRDETRPPRGGARPDICQIRPAWYDPTAARRRMLLDRLRGRGKSRNG